MSEKTTTENNINIHDIKRRSFLGVVTLTSRTFILQVIALISTFILTILLSPEAFGIFFVVTAIVNFLNYFSDIGLAGALIQKREEPSTDDFATTFTIQQILVGLAVICMFLSSNLISHFYKFGPEGLFLFRALIISFLLSSLKTIPSIILERKLDFHKLVIPQIIETLTFYVIAILLALRGFKVASFAWAALARGLVGVTALYIIVPWKPQLRLNKKSARSLLSFGLPFQANSFLALIKDDLLTAYLGIILPFSQVGYIGWAKKWAEIALRLIMDNIIKVTFPAFSRLQYDQKLLAKAIEKSLVFLSLLTFPIALGMVFVVKPFLTVIPKYGKWEPALFSFYFFTVSSVLATLSSPLVNALNALGKVKYTFYLMLMWTALTWLLVPLAVYIAGYNGVAVVATFIGLTSFVPLILVKRIVDFSFIKQISRPAIAASVMYVVLFLLSLLRLSPMLQIMLSIVVGITIYVSIIYQLMSGELRPYFQLLLRKS